MGVGQRLASSQYEHLIKELWRRFPLKVMIRIQHEERKGQQQLAWKRVAMQMDRQWEGAATG